MSVAIPHPTREVLINVALELFAADGVRGTTVRKIEEAAGLSPGAGGMYRHFKSKDELLLAAMERYRADVAELQTRITNLLELGDVRAELLLTAKLTAELNERNEALLRVLLDDGGAIPQAARDDFAIIWQSAYELVADWLERRIGSDSGLDLEAIAVQLFGGLAHYQAQEHTFAIPPMGVSAERFAESWAAHWAEFIERHRQD